jgi:predicted nucleic acid-binding Zn ribbon protein
MPTYDFERMDGAIVERVYPMKDVPETIVCEDGVKAKRIISAGSGFIFKGDGDQWPSQQIKRNREMTRNNIAAGKRGEGEWRERSPKLVQQ